MRLVKRWRWPCSSRRRSLTRGALSSTVPRAQSKLAPLGPAVVHHQRPPLVVALVTVALHIVDGFRRQRRHQHPPRSHPRDLIQLKKLLACFPSGPIVHYLQHRWRLLPPGSHRGSRGIRGRVRRLFHPRTLSTTFGNNSRRRQEEV